MATLRECTGLSKAIYTLEDIGDWMLLDRMNGNVINNTPNSDTANTNFRAGLYKNKHTQERIIAIAGADFLDNKEPVEGRMPKQFERTETFYKYLTEKYVIDKITATGHSLGGACAGYLASQHLEIEAYLINAPQVNELDEIPFVTEQSQNRIYRYYIQKGIVSETLPDKVDPEDPLATAIVGNIFRGVLEGIFKW